MKSDKERIDLNQTLIPRDVGDMTKRRKQIYGSAGAPAHTPKGVAPTFLGSSTEDSKIKNTNAAPDDDDNKEDGTNNPDNDSTSKNEKKKGKEDYQKAYLRKKLENKTQQDKEQKGNATAQAIERDKLLKEETDQRVQAREIQNQVRIWEAKKGEPGYDDTQVDGMVTSLKSQLNGIDPKYWY